MKLLKIGKSPSNNIIINNPTVSSIHAEITLLNDGTIRIEDVNSTNGTYVNNERLTPGVPKAIKPGDVVRMGNATLNWADVMPFINQIPDSKKYKEIFDIGTDNRNAIIISNDQTASRFHCYLLKKAQDGKYYIRDNGSTNGTTVNGKKLQKNQEIQYKKDDTVICGSTDISDQLKNTAYPAGGFPTWLKWTLGGVGAAAAIIAIVLVVKSLIGEKEEPWNPENAVVYVDASYHYQFKFDPHQLPIDKDVWATVVGENVPYGHVDLPISQPYSATAFFLDENGYLATNRHVAIPWEDAGANQSNSDNLKEVWEQVGRNLPYITDELLSQPQVNDNPFVKLALAQTLKHGNSDFGTLNSIWQKLIAMRPEVTGVLDYISVGYPGRNYTHTDEFDRCYVVSTSDTPEKDVALLQLNKGKTPEEIKDVFSMKRAFTGELKPLEIKMRWEGYPRGLGENLDQSTHSLQPQVRETTVGKKPSKYMFEIQGETGHGASGSPIYSPEEGKWYGIVWGGRASTATYSMGCQAKYIKDLYEDATGRDIETK